MSIVRDPTFPVAAQLKAGKYLAIVTASAVHWPDESRGRVERGLFESEGSVHLAAPPHMVGGGGRMLAIFFYTINCSTLLGEARRGSLGRYERNYGKGGAEVCSGFG